MEFVFLKEEGKIGAPLPPTHECLYIEGRPSAGQVGGFHKTLNLLVP